MRDRQSWVRLVFLLVFAVTLNAAEEHGGEHGDPWIWWKWANFAILAVLLGYMMKKYLPPFFADRSQEIQNGIAEAQKIKKDAEARAAEIDRRMTQLGAEIDKLRAESTEQVSREGERIRAETAILLARVRQQAEHEIQAAGNLARRELKAYAAQLAVNLAGERIRERLDASTDARLVEGFVRDLSRQGARN